MFNEKPKVIVNQYKSLDEELDATIAGIFIEGKQSVSYKNYDMKDDVMNRIIPTNKYLILQAIKKWGMPNV